MGEGTNGLMQRHDGIVTVDGREVAADPNDGKSVQQLEQKVGLIREHLTDVVSELDYRRHELMDVKGQLRKHAGLIAGIAGAFAEENNLPELAQSAAVRRADFETARLLHRPWLAQRVHDAATAFVAQLTEHGVTAEKLTAFQATIDAATAGIHQPRTTIIERKAATQRLVALFAEVDALLERQIDRLVLPLAKSSPDFYVQYKAARSIVDAGRRTALPGSEPSATPHAAAAAPSTTPTSAAEADQRAA